MFYEIPSALNGIASDTKVIMWTGHVLCFNCSAGEVAVNTGAFTYLNHTQILIYWGNGLSDSVRRKVSIGTIAHELGHTLGCEGDGVKDACVENSNCIMYPGVSDTTKLQRLEDFAENAYCENCRNTIIAYRDTYLRLAN